MVLATGSVALTARQLCEVESIICPPTTMDISALVSIGTNVDQGNSTRLEGQGLKAITGVLDVDLDDLDTVVGVVPDVAPIVTFDDDNLFHRVIRSA